MIPPTLFYFIYGVIVKGSGKAAKLGIQTANLNSEVTEKIGERLDDGIYFGWAQVNKGPVYKMLMFLGTSPVMHSDHQTAVVHIMHKFDEDFHGSLLKVLVLGHVRPVKDFPSQDDLKNQIHKDMEFASNKLDEPALKKFQSEAEFDKLMEKKE